MTQQSEPADRAEPPFVTDERTMLDAWLDYHRRTLLWKCAGLTGDQLKAAACPPSALTLLGLVRHMTDVERGWFRRILDGQDIAKQYRTEAEPDADLEKLDDSDVRTVFQRFREEIDECRAVTSWYDSLEHTVRPRETISLRWIYTHMVEEYARHNGHADLLREAIDGATGD